MVKRRHLGRLCSNNQDKWLVREKVGVERINLIPDFPGDKNLVDQSHLRRDVGQISFPDSDALNVGGEAGDR
jgi:hypothetical protein